MTSASVVMIVEVVTVAASDSAEDAVRILLQHEISGAPVLDDSGQLVGVISEYQLLAVLYDQQLKGVSVRDLMTSEVMSVCEETPLTEVADLLIAHRIRRLPVVRRGRLVGLISRRDLLRFAISEREDCIDDQTLLRLAMPREYTSEIVASV